LPEPTAQSESEFRAWLEENALEVLKDVGLRGGQLVLDYGCGSGTFAIPAAGIVGDDGVVYALDIDGEALAAVRTRADAEGLGNVQTVLVDASMPPACPVAEPVDVVLLYDVLHKVEDQRAVIEAAWSALKPDGFLSVFPMHIGPERMLDLASEAGHFTLRDRQGLILNFKVTDRRGSL